ncbi:MAG TPA: hypothetical protein VIL00_04130 [Pseudonocardiaceae bacterium]
MVGRQRWLAALLGALAVGSFLCGSLLFLWTTFVEVQIGGTMESAPSYRWSGESPLVLETYADRPVTCRIQPEHGETREVTVPEDWWLLFSGHLRVEPWFTGRAEVECPMDEAVWVWEGRQARLRDVVNSSMFVVGVPSLVVAPLAGVIGLALRSRRPAVRVSP